MVGIRVAVTKYVSDDQPGFVECQFTDAHGRLWTFLEKVPVVTLEELDAATNYPRPGVIGGTIIHQLLDASGRKTVVIDTELPWHIESAEGTTRFDVLPDDIIEWEQ